MNQNRIKRVTIRFTQDEYDGLIKQYDQTTSRQLADYIRKVLLGKLVVVKIRNQSLDELMGVLIALRKDLVAIGRNFNQVVKKLHSVREQQVVNTWLPLSVKLQKELIERAGQIQQRINEFSNKWLQK